MITQASEWYYLTSEYRVVGPLPKAKVAALAHQDDLLVWRHGFLDWILSSQVPSLKREQRLLKNRFGFIPSGKPTRTTALPPRSRFQAIDPLPRTPAPVKRSIVLVPSDPDERLPRASPPRFLPRLESLDGLSAAVVSPCTLGRSRGNAVMVIHRAVSRHHALLWSDPSEQWWIEDLQSLNGTFVNGERINCRALKDKDQIGVFEVKLRFRLRPAR